MNKPQSVSVKDFLIRTLSIKMGINEDVIEPIVSHQFQSANEAMDLNKSVEISGFGKFIFNENKVLKKIKNLSDKQKHFEEVMKDETKSALEIKKATAIFNNLVNQIHQFKLTHSLND